MQRQHSFSKPDNIQEHDTNLKAPAYDVGHQHKFPAGGKMNVPEAPQEKPMPMPVYKADHKSNFEYPKGDLDKPPLPKDLKGEKQ